MNAMDLVVNLNELEQDAVIECPYCSKGKRYSYGAKGKESSNCHICKRMVLWDFDNMTAFKARVKKYSEIK